MKTRFKLLKTMGLCILLLGMAGWAKGATVTATASGGTWSNSKTWVGGNMPLSTDDVVIPSGSTVTITSDVTIGTGRKLTSGGTIDISRSSITSLTINGTIEFNGTTGNVITSTGNGTKTANFILGSGAILITNNSNGIIGNIGSNITPNLNISANYEFNGATQSTTGLPATVNNLTVSGSGTKTLTAVTTITGLLSIGSGTTFNTGNYALTLQGNFSNSGNFNAGSSAITFSGTNAQSIAGFTTTGGVTVNKSTGSATLSGSSTYGSLTITTGNLTIPAGAQVTVTNDLTNNAGLAGLSLLSDATGTGSLMLNNLITSQATVKRYITPGAWHLVSAPVIGQTIGDFLSTNTSIPTPVSATDPRAMRAYEPAGNQWGEFYNSTETNPLTVGKGYCMRVKTNSSHEVVFTGTLQAGDQTINGLSAGNWNCIGNPYTSSITIATPTDGVANFLKENAITNANIDGAYGIYIWDNLDINNGQTGKYTAISNATSSFKIQQGQAFMVKMLTSSVSFTKAMQVHDVSLALKSTDDIWPTINLVATADSINSSTIIAFHDGMTNGLDVTYDAGLLRSGGSLELYTRLIDDYGIPFAIQALPSDQYHSLIIPVGVDYTKGGQVSFSAKGMYLPSSCRPILEDRLTGIVTDLSNQTYSADLSANTAGTGRFYLHTSYTTTGNASRDKAAELSAWLVGNNEIAIHGKINTGAMASLYDLQGRLILTHVMREGMSHRISLPAVNRGIYLLQVRDQQKVQAMKVAIGQ